MEIVKGSIKYYPSKRIVMWNIPLPFKRGLHIEMAWFEGKYPYLEIGLYNWKTCRYYKLFKFSKRRHNALFK